ncbi:hypothetical protein AB0H49_20365 [Nocardia sp. NPDC050713]|uniref:hypothetical protein n=1 Tax=Nocardia sp. NPDC050713 TaxID=3154511 RepID=UPI0033C0DB69
MNWTEIGYAFAGSTAVVAARRLGELDASIRGIAREFPRRFRCGRPGGIDRP